MKTVRNSRVANVIDGKIYVVGGRRSIDYNSSSWIEVFDLETQTWNSLATPDREICGSDDIYSTEVDGKICMDGNGRNGKIVAYNPKDGICEPLERDFLEGWYYLSHCVIDKVVYCYQGKRGFKWFDTETSLWRDLKGLEGIMCKISKLSSVKLVDYGGKIAVLWDRDVFCSRPRGTEVIWCAVIAIERRDDNEEEIWGTVEWFDVVLTVPLYKSMRVVATTL